MNRTRHIKKLSEICNLITDGVHNSPKYVESGIPMLDSKHINDNFFIDDQKPTKFISQETDNLLSKRCKPLANDLLISSRGSIGKIAIVREGQNFNIMGNIILLRLLDNVSSKYIAFSLQSKLDEIQSISRGVAQKGLYLNQVRNFEVALPPLHEQERIVAIVDNAFEGIDRTIANTKKNLTNAHELFESYLNAIFIQKGDGWVEKKLEDICREITVGHVGSMASKYKDCGIPFLRSQNILPFKIKLDNVVFIDDEFHAVLKKSQLRPGDLAIVRTGYPGTAAVIPKEVEIANCSDLVIVKPYENIDSHYLCLFFNSVLGKRLVSGRLVGAAQKHFNITTARKVLIPLPCFAEQKYLVTKTNEIATETQRLEAIYQQKLAALNELKQTILQKAFTGELTADTANQATKTAEGAIAA